jgi:hypothetical protein
MSLEPSNDQYQKDLWTETDWKETEAEKPTLSFDRTLRETKPTVIKYGDRAPTKKEQKALDRELPWREIIKRPADYKQAFCDAIWKEATSWESWGPVKPLTREEASAVLKDKILRKRILRSRLCYRDKNCGRGSLLAKARLVVSGFNDPDLHRLTRNAPTATRMAFFCVLQMAASNFIHGWDLLTADVSTAFLQGSQAAADRELPLFMRPPSDPLVDSTDAWKDAVLYLVLGNIYGLANAPYLWSLEVRAKMKQLGFDAHSLDVMCFIHRDANGLIQAICVFHVDDILLAVAPWFDQGPIRQAFTWGDWDSIWKAPLKYVGKQLRLRPFKEKGVDQQLVVIYQQDFTLGTTTRKVMSGPSKERPLTVPDVTEYRSCGGSLQWLSGGSRPDVSAVTSLLQRGDPQLSDLAGLYAAIELCRQTSDQGIVINPLSLDSLIVVAYRDSSWANAPNLKTQHGFLVCWTTEEAIDGTAAASIVDWKSGRTQRVVRSTLAGGAVAIDASTDHAVYCSKFMGEILINAAAKEPSTVLPIYVCTDAKSLFDVVQQQTPSLSEKRTIIDVAAIKQSIGESSGKLCWVPTAEQLADGLTKISKALQQSLLSFCMDPKINLKKPKETTCNFVARWF